MNITVYANSYDWLFANRGVERAWSLGRFPKPVKAGDWLHFRWEKRLIARATCWAVTAPGERDCVMHDGSRVLRGFKVHWLPSTFEDLRDKPEIVAEIEAAEKERKRKLKAAK